jgi:hypothetical protein
MNLVLRLRVTIVVGDISDHESGTPDLPYYRFLRLLPRKILPEQASHVRHALDYGNQGVAFCRIAQQSCREERIGSRRGEQDVTKDVIERLRIALVFPIESVHRKREYLDSVGLLDQFAGELGRAARRPVLGKRRYSP